MCAALESVNLEAPPVLALYSYCSFASPDSLTLVPSLPPSLPPRSGLDENAVFDDLCHRLENYLKTGDRSKRLNPITFEKDDDGNGHMVGGPGASPSPCLPRAVLFSCLLLHEFSREEKEKNTTLHVHIHEQNYLSR